jgi:hypothetical protein
MIVSQIFMDPNIFFIASFFIIAFFYGRMMSKATSDKRPKNTERGDEAINSTRPRNTERGDEAINYTRPRNTERGDEAASISKRPRREATETVESTYIFLFLFKKKE